MGKLYKFKLKIGQHIARDYSQKPRKYFTPEGKIAIDHMTGEELKRYPSHTYRADEPGNDIVLDTVDLVARFGEEKFSYEGERPPVRQEKAISRVQAKSIEEVMADYAKEHGGNVLTPDSYSEESTEETGISQESTSRKGKYK